MSLLTRDYIAGRHPSIEAALRSSLPASRLGPAAPLNGAIAHAVFPGGRRMRPILTLLAAEICGGNPHDALRVACAVEFLHAASLVIDDLPSMDDARLRRGRAAAHVLYGADVAILAALALLNQSYALFAEVPGLLPRAVREIGVDGMIGGQAVDLAGAPSWSRMEKTTALTRLTMAAGAAAARAASADAAVVTAFGHALGEAYQICDDFADALGTEAELGKTAGQDRRHGRGSAVDHLGPGDAFDHAAELIEKACTDLRAHFGPSGPCRILDEFARSIVRPKSMAAR